MKIEILSEKENPLLKRKEFEVKITHDAATPSISEIRKKITSKDIGKGTVIIDSFKSKHGSRETLGAVKVYQTKERALEIEPRHRLIKNELIEITEEKPGEPKPEEIKEEQKEKPIEKTKEKKEEPKPKKELKKAEKEPKPKEEEKPKEESKPREEPKPEKVKEEPAEKPKKESKKAEKESKPSEKPKDKSTTKEGE